MSNFIEETATNAEIQFFGIQSKEVNMSEKSMEIQPSWANKNRERLNILRAGSQEGKIPALAQQDSFPKVSHTFGSYPEIERQAGSNQVELLLPSKPVALSAFLALGSGKLLADLLFQIKDAGYFQNF